MHTKTETPNEELESDVFELRREVWKLKRDLVEVRETAKGWLKENAPGGWIDNLRKDLADAKEEIQSDRALQIADLGVINSLREQLVKARPATGWMLITSENLPKKGDVFFMRLQESGAVSAGIATVDWQLSTVRGDYEQWFISSPAPEGSKL
jgi:hypothetical protein